MKNKIIIGTANFGNRYGILKEKAKLGQIKKILNNGHKLGLRYLDASEDYNSFNQIKKKAKKYNIFISRGFLYCILPRCHHIRSSTHNKWGYPFCKKIFIR